MASVHLSISKYSVIFLLKRRGGLFFLPMHHRTLHISAFPFLLQPFLPSHSSTPHLSFYIIPPAFLLFRPSPLHPPPPTLHRSSSSPALSVERPIQQQNKAAHSIARSLIKQDQNAAALPSPQHRRDTRQHRRGESSVTLRRRRGESRV